MRKEGRERGDRRKTEGGTEEGRGVEEGELREGRKKAHFSGCRKCRCTLDTF